MVSNDNLQQINTFTSGMDLDTADQYLDSTKYREAFNLRVVTDADGTSGSLTNTEGVRYFQTITTQLPTNYTDPVVIHVNSVRKYGVIMLKAMKDGKEYYFIFRFVNKNDLADGEDGTPKLIFGPCPTSLGDNPSTVIRWEDDDNIKLYYADGMNAVRVINISPEVDATRPMLDDGSFSIYPTAELMQPEFVSFGSGNLMTGSYQYGYQLFTRNGSETEISPLTGLIQVSSSPSSVSNSSAISGSPSGERTNRSIRIRIPAVDKNYNMMRIISVFYENTVDEPRIQILREMSVGSYEDVSFQDISNQGISIMTLEEFNMITSVHFAPKLLETKNNYLFASDIQYKDQIFDVDYDSRAYSGLLKSDLSNDTYAVLKSASGGTEITANLNSIASGSIIVPSNHDVINPFTDLSKQYTSFIDSYTSGMDTVNAKCAYMYDGSNGVIWGGKGRNIKWRFAVSELEERSGDPYITGGYSRYGSNPNQFAESRPFQGVWVSYVNKDGTFVGKRFNKLSDTTITIPCNYASQIIRSNCMSLHRDEVYRYGIVMYDKHRNATPVKWIADIRTPALYQKGFETFFSNTFTSFLSDGSGRLSALATRPLGIEFEVTNLPAEVVSYEIVRVRRTESDRATVTQGVISKTSRIPSSVLNGGTGSYTEYSRFGTPLITMNGGAWISDTYDNLYRNPCTMTSPEICFNRENLKTTMPSNLRLENLVYLFSATGKTVLTNVISDARVHSTHSTPWSIPKYEYDARLVNFSYSGYNFPKLNLFLDSTGILSSGGSEEVPRRDLLLNMFEQSTEANTMWWLSSGSIANPTKIQGITSGSSYDVGKPTFPNETSWSDSSNLEAFVSSVAPQSGGQAFSYIDWMATKFNLLSSTKEIYPAEGVGPHGRCIVMDVRPFDLLNPPGSADDMAMVFLSKVRKLTSSATIPLASSSTHSAQNNSVFWESSFGAPLCNLRKTIVAYGGSDYQSRQFSTYIPQAAHSPSTTTTRLVFSGDTYIGVLRHIKSHYTPAVYGTQTVKNVSNRVQFYYIPCESSINLSLEHGQDTNVYMQKEPANVNGLLIQTLPMYVYNGVFSIESSVRLFTPEQALDEYNKHIDVRTHYSLRKNNDELTDSWTKFKPLNFLDVDSQHGSINNLRTFHTQLIFWQDNAMGLFQVEDRSLIQDQSNSPLLLGTSGVLDRYDYIHTKNGMKHGHHDTDCQSDTILYFYDYDKRELCAYTNNQVTSLGKVGNVQSYIERIGSSEALQAPKPILTYDNKYDECLATLSATESLIYSERAKAFTGFYTLMPQFRVYFDGDVYFVKGHKLYKYNDGMVNNGFEDQALPIRLNYLVNAQYPKTKVYDNIEFAGELVKSSIKFDFISSYLSSNTLPGSDLSMREYNYRGAIPRVESTDKFANRMRGRVLYCTMRYNQDNFEGTRIVTIINEEFMQTIVDNDNIIANNVQPGLPGDGTRFELPYIRTTFRISQS